MPLYALEIREHDLELLTMLNDGVTPPVEKRTTYLILDVEPNSVSTKIVKERELLQNYDISGRPRTPVFLRLRK